MNMENERRLSAGLAAISSQAIPPPSVKNAVMAEFRRVHRTVPIRRPLMHWAAMAAAAAAFLLAIFVGRMPRPEQIAVRVPSAIEAPPPVLVSPSVPARVARQVKRPRAVKVQPAPAPAPPESGSEVATDFFEIPYAEPLRPQERVDVFRMQIPRANIAVFGLPVSGGRLDSRVTADVLVGEDGVMRAIRFIR